MLSVTVTMAEDEEKIPSSSIRQLPKGQLESIRKMWESKGDQSTKGDDDSKSGLERKDQEVKAKPFSGEHKDPGKPPIKQGLTRPRPLTAAFTDGSPSIKKDISSDEIRLRITGNRKPRAKSDVPETASAVAKAVFNHHNKSPFVGNGQSNPKPRERSPKSILKNAAASSPKTSMGVITTSEKKIDTKPHGKSDLVSRRTKLFESPNIDASSKGSENKQSNVTLRPTPSVKPRSRPTSGSSDGDADHSKPENSSGYDPPWESGRFVISSGPPKKPPRTGAHDHYMKVKLKKPLEENEKSTNEDDEDVVFRKNILYESIYDVKDEVKENQQEKPAPVYKRIEKPQSNLKPHVSHRKNPSISSDEGDDITGKPKKPSRPPPPRPRPISVAVDNLSEHPAEIQAGHNHHKLALPKVPAPRLSSDSQTPYYEDINETRGQLDLDNIKHWDLSPVRRGNMRRSMSAECIAGRDDPRMNDPIYVDPVQFRDDIYVDSAGYAVPNRHQRLEQTKSWDIMSSSPGGRPLSAALKNKFGGLKKKLFSPDLCSKSRSSDPTESARSAKKKLQNVKTKINLAFTVLRMMKKSEDGTENSEDDPNADTASNESDSLVDVKEIEKRKDYCHLVRKNTVRSNRVKMKKDANIYPQMFDYGVIVGLEPKENQVGYLPKILYKFPDLTHIRLDSEGRLGVGPIEVDSNVSVPQFCFPDAEEFDVKSASPAAPSESYSFVLTNLEGGRVYGYCRRLVPLETPAGLPEVICIISPIDAFNMYNELLNEIEERRQHSLYLAQELIAASFGRPMPNPGNSVNIKSLDEHGEVGTLLLTRPTDARIDSAQREMLLSRLGTDKLLKIFSCMLLERSVLFCAKNLNTLTQTINALSSLLYPFRWQHVYIPVLPEKMLEVCCSPTPYLIGILSSHVQRVQALPLSEIVIFDLNKKQMLKSSGDEGTLLPKNVQKALKTALNMCKFDADAKNAQNMMIFEAFLRFFVEAVGHYSNHITSQQDGQKVFLKENFIKDSPSESMQQFLEWFCETQMFEVFITSQVEKAKQSKTIETFDTRIMECRLEQEKLRKSFESGKSKRKLKKFLKTS